MKITSFQPMLITPAENTMNAVSAFEALGFSQQHYKDENTEFEFNLKSADGNRVCVLSSVDAAEDKMTLRMNVDDLDEAAALLEAQGFTKKEDGFFRSTDTSRECTMVSPSGFWICISQHLK